MKSQLAVDDISRLVGHISAGMREKSEELARLDSLTGDGDMGVTITLCMRAMAKTASKLDGCGMAEALELMGEQVGETAPSTFGTLFATMLKSMGRELKIAEADIIDSVTFARILNAAARGVMERGNAKPGEKTMLDALIPAARSAQLTADNGDCLASCAEKAAEAARTGAESTIGMKAVTGRAGYMGERSIGSKDPGAEAIAAMLAAFRSFFEL